MFKLLRVLSLIAFYNVIDNAYQITPTLTLYLIGGINKCLSILSLVIHTLNQII
jgi:hypothetical protein